MTKYSFIQRLVSFILLISASLSAWSSDYVLIGTYTNDRNGKDYDVILEYEGDKFVNLEINVRGDEDSQFCAWEIRGDKKIQNLYTCFINMFATYKSIDDLCRNRNIQSGQETIEVEWPSFKLQGRHFGKTSNYEMENLIDDASVQAYYSVKNGVRQLMILAVLIDDYGDAPLKSALNFTSPESCATFIHLIDPDFLAERVRLKQKLLNEGR